MHYHCEIWFPDRPDDIEKAVAEAMAPHLEVYEADGGGRGIWDWYQIGGRWKGCHDSTYDASSDESHKAPCVLCEGTGKRSDGERFGAEWMAEMNGCNGCKGSGVAVTWPTTWKPHDLDAIAVDALPGDFKACTLIANGHAYVDRLYRPKYPEATDGFDGRLKVKLAELGLVGGWVVTVDYHS